MTMENKEQNKMMSGQDPTGKELYELRKREKRTPREKEQHQEKLKRTSKKFLLYLLLIIGGVGIVGGIAWLIITSPKAPNLPPTTAQGHTETMPDAHITDQPIPDSMQRHMLEHADGKGKPGVIIQYDCKKYTCETNLIQKLTDLAKQYPDNVYLAPSDYDGKIILTKEGSIKILENFDEQVIKDFIGSK